MTDLTALWFQTKVREQWLFEILLIYPSAQCVVTLAPEVQYVPLIVPLLTLTVLKCHGWSSHLSSQYLYKSKRGRVRLLSVEIISASLKINRQANSMVWYFSPTGAASVSEMASQLKLTEMKGRKWHVQGTCAPTADGVYEGMHELARLVKEFTRGGHWTNTYWHDDVPVRTMNELTHTDRTMFRAHIEWTHTDMTMFPGVHWMNTCWQDDVQGQTMNEHIICTWQDDVLGHTLSEQILTGWCLGEYFEWTHIHLTGLCSVTFHPVRTATRNCLSSKII
jgi:hypothetical protein